jgi:hypothetical protein
MQVVENWAWLTSRLMAVTDHDQYIELEVLVESTAPEPGYPDLLAQFIGSHARIRIASPLANVPPARFAIKACLAGPLLIWGDASSVRAAN